MAEVQDSGSWFRVTRRGLGFRLQGLVTIITTISIIFASMNIMNTMTNSPSSITNTMGLGCRVETVVSQELFSPSV